MKSFLVTALRTVLLFACAAQVVLAQGNDAPFGLSWGLSAEDLRARGVNLAQTKRESEFTFFSATKVPTAISIAEKYSIIVHDRHGLQKLAMHSENFNNDPSGADGKKIYAEYKAALASKYGPPDSSYSREIVGLKLYKERDEFYECLKYTGCGMWSSLWSLPNGGTIGLELKGINRGTGWLNLTYEGPRWSDAVDNVKANRSAQDRKAL
ncbi:MAG: hypothetical protein ACOYLV_08250 [Rubrivivax sp.]